VGIRPAESGGAYYEVTTLSGEFWKVASYRVRPRLGRKFLEVVPKQAIKGP
jgi:hypothetical protein